MYNITVDKRINLVEVELSGLVTPSEAASYISELKRQFVINRLHSYSMIIDASACPIQSQETLGAMREHIAAMPKARSLAIVTGNSLVRMQIRKLFTQPYARITATTEEARAWVVYGSEPALV